jgi:hypothetical protein
MTNLENSDSTAPSILHQALNRVIGNILPSMKQMTAEGKVQHRPHNITSYHIIQCFQEEKLEKLLMLLVHVWTTQTR